jgi:multidrug efflux pump subunit AcrA (membrane-fusion protein)
MSRKKKILIGAGAVVVLGAVAFANFKFKRTEGTTVNTEAVQKRKLEAIVSASGKIQPKRFVNISADTSGRVTELAVNEGDRVTKGQFLLQIDPRNLRTRVTSGEASLGAARSSAEQLKLALESSRTQLKLAQDNYKRQQELWKGGLTTREQFERAESELRVRQQDLPRPGTERPHAADADGSGGGDAGERQNRLEQGAHRSADRRHHHAAQRRAGGNRGGRHHEQRRNRAAASGRHVGDRSRGRGRRDRYFPT